MFILNDAEEMAIAAMLSDDGWTEEQEQILIRLNAKLKTAGKARAIGVEMSKRVENPMCQS